MGGVLDVWDRGGGMRLRFAIGVERYYGERLQGWMNWWVLGCMEPFLDSGGSKKVRQARERGLWGRL